jgi:hypothetical protein
MGVYLCQEVIELTGTLVPDDAGVGLKVLTLSSTRQQGPPDNRNIPGLV